MSWPPASPPSVITDLGVEVEGVGAPTRDLPASKFGYFAHLLRHRLPLGAWMVAPAVQQLIAGVARAEAEGHVDLVHVMPQEAAPIVAATRTPSALLLGDSYWVQADRALRAATSPLERIRLKLERRHARNWERGWYPKAGAVACVSPADAAALRGLCDIQVDAVPLPIGDEWFAAPSVRRGSNTVTLIGALDYWPNVDAVVWFARDVWPLVRSVAPEAVLQVVGRRPAPAVVDAVNGAGGQLVADVPDVRPYYWEAAVVVAPIRLGRASRTRFCTQLRAMRRRWERRSRSRAPARAPVRTRSWPTTPSAWPTRSPRP